MAGKPKRMSQVKQLLRLHKQGNSIKAIARTLEVSKNTVKVYLEKVKQSSLSIDALLDIDDFELEKKFHSGNPAYKDLRYEQLKNNLNYYVSELGKKGVTRQLLWEEYKEGNPKGYARTQFFYHLSQQINASNPTMVLGHKPAEKLYIDFAGKTFPYTDPHSGEVVQCQIFVGCLPYSDYGFAMAVRSQSIEDFIYALRCCLEAIGGVPQAIVPDNLKSAIIKASRYEPTVNRALEDLANHYNTTIVPTRVAKPRDKGLVENHVRLIYQRVFARLRNDRFLNMESLNKAISKLVKKHNQTRMQQKPYCREELFLADEKPLLKKLPEKPFELKYYTRLKVAKNNHIYLAGDKHYYSVPFTHIGQKANVIFTRTMVYIYIDHKQVAVHPRSFAKGQYTTNKLHLCSTHQYYLDRSPGYYIKKAEALGTKLHQLIQLIFNQDRYPEQLYRSCEGIFSLRRKTDPQMFEKACQIAIDNQIYTYTFLVNLIANKRVSDQQDQQNNQPLPIHKNIRGKGYYS